MNKLEKYQFLEKLETFRDEVERDELAKETEKKQPEK